MNTHTLTILARIGAYPLIGRDTEIQVIGEKLVQVQDGSGIVIAVSGEPGIGKTRLMREIVQLAVAKGAHVIETRCYRETSTIPYAPLFDSDWSALGLALIVREALPQTSDAYSLNGARLGIFEHIDRHLVELAEGQTQVIALDDLQWADSATLDLLQHLARRGRRGKRVILITIRSSERTPQASAGQWLAALSREESFFDLPLAPLNRNACDRFIAEMLAQPSSALTDALFARTEGVPLYIEETVRALLSEQRLTHAAGTWKLTNDALLEVPEPIISLTAQRVRALSAQTRNVIEAGAVLGVSGSLDLLARVVRMPRTAVSETLQSAIASRLIRCETVGQHTNYQFVHALLRDSIYVDMAPERVIANHRQVLQVLMLGQVDDISGSHALIAYHAEIAHEWQIAFDARVAAGHAAQKALASREACGHFQQARHLLTTCSQIETAITFFTLDRWIITTTIGSGQFSEAVSEARSLIKRAAHLDDQATEAWGWIQLGHAETFLHRLDTAHQALEQGRTLAEQIGDDATLVTALSHLAVLCDKRGLLDEGEMILQQALPLAERLGNRALALNGLIYLGFIKNWRGQFDEAVEELRKAQEIATRAYDILSLANARFALALALAGRGDYGASLQELHHLLDYAAMTGSRFYAIRAPNTIGWIYRELGLAEQARRWDEQAIAETAERHLPGFYEAYANSLLNLGSDLLLLGHLDEAERILQQGKEAATEDEFMRWRNLNRLALCLGELALARGDAAGALNAADEALWQAEAKRLHKYIALAHDLAARALMQLHRADEARTRIEAAIDEARAIGYLAGLWRSLATHGYLMNARRAASAAKASRTEACTIIQRLALTLDESDRSTFLAQPMVVALMKATNKQNLPGHIEKPIFPADLTGREVQVLRLVAQGQTNHDIAAELVLSERTINSHLVRIFNKLAVNNRAAAAAFATRHGLDR